MNSLRKFIVFMVTMLLSSVAIADYAAAEPLVPDSHIPIPSVPQFTIKLVDASYDVPTTTSIDPFTGNVTTNEGYHVERAKIEFKIKNEPFTAYIGEGDSRFHVLYYYHIQYKGPYEQEWHTIVNYDNSPLLRSDEEETIYQMQVTYSPQYGLSFLSFQIPSGCQIDFRMQAIIGHWVSNAPFSEDFEGQTSGWVTKTLNVGTWTVEETPSPTPTNSPSSSPIQSPSPTPLQPNIQSDAMFGLGWEQVAAVVLLGVIAVSFVFVVVYLRKRAVVPK